jgi:ribulose-5-phosphate 4-epimerase/fuculose-1-phosphate aldolase
MAEASKAIIDDLKKRLVESLYVLSEEGVLGAMGHISVRVPGTDMFLINPRYAPNVADVEDICLVPVYPEAHQVDTPERGNALAVALGDHLAVLQRGHGIASVGPSIEGCCLVSIRLENTCRDQLEVMKYTTRRAGV